MLQNSILFAQDDYEIIVPKFIMKTTGFKTYPYQLSDGTPLEYKDIYTVISEIPENMRLLNDAKKTRTNTIILAGISLISGLLQTYVSVFPDNLGILGYYENILPYITYSALLGSIITGMTYNNEIQKAVDKYNLYIMGIPVN
jgi:hypothetical protein